ncbi:MAG: zinc ABC transporter substrate-binding protein [Candidatus Pacebacteria bacterium]|nr:zinc ABC transporter substrate-binding protein [Candidatus Paceibacterota bacterium]
MKTTVRRLRGFILGIFILLAGPSYAEVGPIKIIASTTLVADFAREIGGERVAVESLIQAGGDPHEYQARPRDAIAMNGARLVIVNGLGLDGGIERLARSTVGGARTIVLGAQAGIKPIGKDPHIWQDPNRVRVMVEAIAARLTVDDPNGAEYYRQRLELYLQRLSELDREIRQGFAKIPSERRKIITSHDAFGYFAVTYGIEFLAPEGTASQSEASARRLVGLIEQIKRERIRVIFIETISDPRLIEQIARETGARVGLPLYSDSLSAESGPAGDYLAMMRYNLAQFLRAMEGGE